MAMTLPNLMTLARLAAAPLLALVFAALPRPAADAVALVLFVGASATDWLDGFLARRWGQTSRFGAMLDPIADKAMVIIAVAVVLGLSELNPMIVLPAAVILFREVFVSGLREFLGDTAGTLAVTKLAKWKTTVQMVALSVLLAAGALSGALAGAQGLAAALFWLGVALLWAAAVLTAMTGLDYYRKALPHLREPA